MVARLASAPAAIRAKAASTTATNTPAIGVMARAGIAPGAGVVSAPGFGMRAARSIAKESVVAAVRQTTATS
jgi:hypothetical protein